MTATHAKKLVFTANGQSRALPASLIIHARSTPAQSYAIYIKVFRLQCSWLLLCRGAL